MSKVSRVRSLRNGMLWGWEYPREKSFSVSHFSHTFCTHLSNIPLFCSHISLILHSFSCKFHASSPKTSSKCVTNMWLRPPTSASNKINHKLLSQPPQHTLCHPLPARPVKGLGQHTSPRSVFYSFLIIIFHHSTAARDEIPSRFASGLISLGLNLTFFSLPRLDVWWNENEIYLWSEQSRTKKEKRSGKRNFNSRSGWFCFKINKTTKKKPSAVRCPRRQTRRKGGAKGEGEDVYEEKKSLFFYKLILLHTHTFCEYTKAKDAEKRSEGEKYKSLMRLAERAGGKARR